MPVLTLYIYSTSPYAAKVAAVLHYKNIDFEVVHVNPVTKRELAFANKRVVPTLRIDGEWRQESSEICFWLDELFPQHPILGSNASQREQILSIDKWVSDNFLPGLFRALIHWDGSYLLWLADRWRYAATLHQSRPLPLLLRAFYPWLVQHTPFIRAHASGTSWDEPLSEMHQRLLDEFLDHLNSGPFLGGLSTPSLADFALFPAVAVPWLIGLKHQGMFLEHDSVRQWIRRVETELPQHPYLIERRSVKRKLDTIFV